MKRLISLVISAILLVNTFSLCASAAETSASERDELIALACNAFPEYASTIREGTSPYSSPSRSASSDQIVFSETRDVSENESITVSLYASGDVIIIDQGLDAFPITIVDENTSAISNVGVSGTADFKMTGPGRGIFKLNNVSFVIYYYASDYFTNNGTIDLPDNTYNDVAYVEISNSTTFIQYNVTFNMSGQPKSAPFQLYFSDNQLVARTY